MGMLNYMLNIEVFIFTNKMTLVTTMYLINVHFHILPLYPSSCAVSSNGSKYPLLMFLQSDIQQKSLFDTGMRIILFKVFVLNFM